MYVCMYVCTYVRMYACMHACIMHACMHACTYACTYVCIRACIHVCMHACMYVCMHACMYTCMYAHVGDQGREPAAQQRAEHPSCECDAEAASGRRSGGLLERRPLCPHDYRGLLGGFVVFCIQPAWVWCCRSAQRQGLAG